MGASKELFIGEQEKDLQPKVQTPQKKSLFNIRQDHMSLLAEIEENEGELTEEMTSRLQLSQEDFQSKAISYGFVIRKLDAESDVIAAEIKRLQALKSKADRKADLFRQMIDEGMKEFGYDKVESELLKISYRKSTPVDLTDNFSDNILQYVSVEMTIKPDTANKAAEAGVTDEVLSLFEIKPVATKERIKEAIKQGISVPGAVISERKSIQIK